MPGYTYAVHHGSGGDPQAIPTGCVVRSTAARGVAPSGFPSEGSERRRAISSARRRGTREGGEFPGACPSRGDAVGRLLAPLPSPLGVLGEIAFGAFLLLHWRRQVRRVLRLRFRRQGDPVQSASRLRLGCRGIVFGAVRSRGSNRGAGEILLGAIYGSKAICGFAPVSGRCCSQQFSAPLRAPKRFRSGQLGCPNPLGCPKRPGRPERLGRPGRLE